MYGWYHIGTFLAHVEKVTFPKGREISKKEFVSKNPFKIKKVFCRALQRCDVIKVKILISCYFVLLRSNLKLLET